VHVCAAGHAVPDDAPEQLCPLCLVDLAEPASSPTQIGPFSVMGRLGEGGFGLVYRARREGAAEIVALKVLRSLEFADDARVAQFRREPTLSAKLDPEYVVQVLEVGEHAGVPYFTMEYLAGGTLRERMPQYLDSPQRAAELMIQIARAVQYLHHDPERPEREPILHRDLKPENILFGADGRPRISDFGIAKLAKNHGAWTVGAAPVGCPAYMAPEQVYPTARGELTAAADVYALGAILYELFTGRAPFEGTDAKVLVQLRDEEPQPPRRLTPSLDRFLETVVLNALEKDPARRYRSAAGFAQDLQRALQKKPPEEAPPVATAARLVTWIKRRPLASAAWLWAAALVCVVGLSVHATQASRAQSLEREQQTNASIAGMQAVAVNLQLRAYKQRIAELAQDPEVIALATSPRTGEPPQILRERRAPFDTMFVMAPDGRQQARSSAKPTEYLSRSFAFRDYFGGARRLAAEVCRDDPGAVPVDSPRRAYVARAYSSESDGHFEFAVSAPLCRGSTWLGLIAGSIATDKVLGAVRLLDDHNGRIASVLGPRDRERHQAHLALPADLTFIVHPGLERGQALALRDPSPTTIRAGLGISSEAKDATLQLRYTAPLRVDDYRDPVQHFDGAWSATFAAADESGYIVGVQSRRDTTRIAHVVIEKLALPAGVPFAVGFLSLALIGLARRPSSS
jgi:serine/threonine protein kinase